VKILGLAVAFLGVALALVDGRAPCQEAGTMCPSSAVPSPDPRASSKSLWVMDEWGNRIEFPMYIDPYPEAK
jgi:hypothetical protein